MATLRLAPCAPRRRDAGRRRARTSATSPWAVGRAERACGDVQGVAVIDANGARGTIATGAPFLDHMIDQLTAHAQLGVHCVLTRRGVTCEEARDAGGVSDEEAFRCAGAALGAVAALWFGYAAAPYLLPAFALIGAGGAMALLAAIAGRTGGIALFTLAGLMVASLAGALTALAISMAPNAFAMSEIVMWLNGALTDRSWRDVWVAAPLVALGIVVLARAGAALDALTLGEPVARSRSQTFTSSSLPLPTGAVPAKVSAPLTEARGTSTFSAFEPGPMTTELISTWLPKG